MEVYMESVKAFKFMNGWVVKRKYIDEVKDAISRAWAYIIIRN